MVGCAVLLDVCSRQGQEYLTSILMCECKCLRNRCVRSKRIVLDFLLIFLANGAGPCTYYVSDASRYRSSARQCRVLLCSAGWFTCRRMRGIVSHLDLEPPPRSPPPRRSARRRARLASSRQQLRNNPDAVVGNTDDPHVRTRIRRTEAIRYPHVMLLHFWPAGRSRAHPIVTGPFLFPILQPPTR